MTLHLVMTEALPEPTDEEIWLAGIARTVDADARPLFILAMRWLTLQSLERDEDQEP